MKKRTTISALASSPVFFGIAVGALAVAAQLLFMPGRNAYGICTVCHARDLLAWATEKATRIGLDGAVSHLALPVFTTVGLILGSLAASVRHREFRWISAGRSLRMLVLGVFTAGAGLVVMSCPTRLFLRFSYADPFALIALAGLFAGILAATAIMRRW